MNTTNNFSLLSLRFLIAAIIFCLPFATIHTSVHHEIDDLNLEEISFTELAFRLSIPPGKLIKYFDLDPDINRSMTPAELGIDRKSIDQARLRFKKNKWRFSWNIVLLGMLVIFSSLSLTGLFISLLSKVVLFSESSDKSIAYLKKKKNEGLRNIKSRDTSYNAVVAAITAFHLHIQEAEEFGKMTLSWKREPVSVWKTSGKLDMPNRILLTNPKTK
jgi:Na+-transporting methylmalonyl-CoA/oxaloacetate decarboxylase gamma subunit